MRALTAKELRTIAGGRQASHGDEIVNPDLDRLPPGTTDPGGVTVIGFDYDGPPPGFDSWFDWDAMNTFYWEAAPGGGGGGSDQPYSYNDGVHNVYATTATSKNGLDNPGDIMWGSFAQRHGATASSSATKDGTLAQFKSEQSGLDALASLLDHNYATDSIGDFAFDYMPEVPNAITEEGNVEVYMNDHGYHNYNDTIADMSNAEFNTFVNAISVAEGNTNVGG